MIERHEVAWIVGGIFAFAAVGFSFFQIRGHLLYTRDMYRKYVVRILLMVPLYAIEAWLGLRFKDATMYFDVLRECYEAFVIFSFYQFLVIYLGGEDHLLITILAQKPQQKHVFPFCCKKPWTMGGPNDTFLLNTKIGVLQYVVVKPVLGLISFICNATGVYGDGEIKADRAYPYVAFFANASQIWAMYCLVLFYMATKPELAPCRPIPKFLCVKATVFFTWWQGVLLAVLAKVGLLGETETYTTENVVMGLQDFILCIEMLIASIAHHYAFNYKDFSDPNSPSSLNPDGSVSPSLSSSGTTGARPLVRSIFEAVNVSDIFLTDVRHVTAQVQKKRKRKTDQQLLQAADYSDERKLNTPGMLGAGKISIDMTALRRDASVTESSLAGDDDGEDGDDTSPLTTPQSAAAASAAAAAAVAAVAAVGTAIHSFTRSRARTNATVISPS